MAEDTRGEKETTTPDELLKRAADVLAKGDAVEKLLAEEIGDIRRRLVANRAVPASPATKK